MEIYGGRAGFNSVSFTSEKYQSISRYKDKEILTEIRVKKEYKIITNVLSSIPFIRSFSLLFDLIIEYWGRFLFGIIALFLMDVIFIGNSNNNLLYSFPINSLEILVGFFVIAGLIIKISPVGGYHAAEHMVVHAYEKDINLTLENVKKQPRVNDNCGTNLVASIFICFSILFTVFGDQFWVFLVSWSIGYELWKSEPKIIWDLTLIVGKVAQYLLFTSKPKDKHLMVAIEAIKRLEEKEFANKVE